MYEPYILTPLVLQMSSPLALEDIAQIVIPRLAGNGVGMIALDAQDWSVSARKLDGGTAILVCKNGAGQLVVSVPISEEGFFTFTPLIAKIATGDRLRFGFSNVGTGLADVTVTAWLKLPSMVL